MTTINDFSVTGLQAKAAQYNLLLGSIFRGEISNATTMSGTVTLTDGDTAIQRFDCNGANRIVKLPAYATSNHPYFIINTTAATYTLDVQSSAAVSLLATPLQPLAIALVIPDGTAGYKLASGPLESWVAPSTSGNVLTSNGTIWTSAASSGGGTYPFMSNGKLSVTVASNNLTVALKTWAGADPSAGDPVKVYLGGALRTITAALSVTKNAATNWCNAGGAELATKEIDYFAYLGYNATDGVTIGFSRIPYAKVYSDFNTTSTNEKYAAISTITNAAASDEYAVIGRFAATLSAGAGYTWTVPTFTPANLVQGPIFNTRVLTYVPALSASGSMTWTTTTIDLAEYYIDKQKIFVEAEAHGTTGGTASTNLRLTVPFNARNVATGVPFYCLVIDTSGNFIAGNGQMAAGTPNIFACQRYDSANFGLGAGRYANLNAVYAI